VGHGFLISSDLPGVTPGDEVISKYFCTAPKTDIPTPKTNTNAFLDITSPLLDMSLPEKTRKFLEDLDLSSDFLSSDSSLSDPPSDLDDVLALYPTPEISPSKNLHFLALERTSGPSTHVNRTKFLEPGISRDPRPKQPKISPYFPKTPDPPQSCLPFPPIDAPSFGLVQEQLAHEPFKLLIATIFLNRTRGGVALPVLFKAFERYPTIHAMASADLAEFVSMIRCLGFQNQRAKKCIGIAQLWQTDPPVKNKRYRKIHYPKKLDGRDIPADEYLDDEDPRAAWEIAHLPGVGAYSLDSWRIFCRDELRGLAKDWKGTGSDVRGFVPEWKSVLPQDKELRAYLTWMWLKEGWVWDCHSGDLTPAGDKTLRAARREGVAHEEDGNWVLQTSPVKKAPNGLHAID
jgi:endonuclease III